MVVSLFFLILLILGFMRRRRNKEEVRKSSSFDKEGGEVVENIFPNKENNSNPSTMERYSDVELTLMNDTSPIKSSEVNNSNNLVNKKVVRKLDFESENDVEMNQNLVELKKEKERIKAIERKIAQLNNEMKKLDERKKRMQEEAEIFESLKF